MSIQTVWRVEDDEGRGPYVSTDFSWQTETHSANTGRPGPYDDLSEDDLFDFKSEKNEYFIFGFKTLESLQKWFDKKELKRLKEIGFAIKECKGEIKYHGDKQVIFVKEEFLEYV